MLVVTLALTACASGPDYVRPALPLPAAYKESGPWKPAEPQLADTNHPWWAHYGDTELDTLVAQANEANQNIRMAEAQYRQARATAQLARAGYAPTLGAGTSIGRARTHTAPTPADSNALTLQASWEPDIWGRVQRSVEAGEAALQASEADLAGARLSIQAELVQDYLQLRITDAEKDLILRTVQEYEKALSLTRSQYKAGVVTRADVALAETQLQSARAQAIDLDVRRTQFEHAIAILTGRAPAEVTIAPRPSGTPGIALPVMPGGLPSQLLERRPDIAAAERRAAAANAQIGVAQSAYFPSLVLNASGGFASAGFSQWITAPSRVWSLGAALAETIFDGGARSARTDQAVAAYDVAAAQYKRTVLAGLQEVEDNLAALRVLDAERAMQESAVESARVAERTSLARYRAGTTTYLSVVTAQTLLLSNERSALQAFARQLAASAALVKALGGGWNAAGLAAGADGSAAAPQTTHVQTVPAGS
ncbi:MAG TPA: efflux transporter outer membrane subunit [Noviherbaspirillum sp.]|uniref:efflux transporter outer membrane subunit n=1 Tax=Noviherbaspirillum sp. TaxID=1926288 RepID=UPI002B49982D|nr:efflux transporter outer membrane subunit [Noviherbaspirillum sp.]HJV84628.1 efflux transporter outer membrane subunit [Noviherbaspirillum sp.]